MSGRAYNGRAKTSRFTGVSWHDSYSKWKAQIYVRGSTVELGLFEVEEDAARNYDAAVVEYELSGRTLNFPGEAPRADVLDALPPPPTRGVASRQIERERRPPRHLPRGSKFPGGGQATPARKLVFVEEDDVDEAAGLALLALARCA